VTVNCCLLRRTNIRCYSAYDLPSIMATPNELGEPHEQPTTIASGTTTVPVLETSQAPVPEQGNQLEADLVSIYLFVLFFI
jgi:hypothetical protein